MIELASVKKGMKAKIMTKQHKYSTGIVEDVAPKLTKEKEVVVRLSNGDIGSVEKLFSQEVPQAPESDLDKLLKKGENFFCEFKAEALWSQNYTEEDIAKSRSLDVNYYKKKASRVIIAKSIAAFLNSEGGNLIIGVKENKDDKIELIGVQEEFKKLRDQCKDGYKRLIIDEIIKPHFPSKIVDNLNKHLYIDFVNKEDKILCWIRINKSPSRVFLSLNAKDVFMIRTDSENRFIDGEKLVEYCLTHFK